MANLTGRKRDGPHLIRSESGKLVLPDEYAARIRNMVLTEEGTLRSVEGPCPYVPDYGAGYSLPTKGGGQVRGFDDYGTTFAIGHGFVNGRELLLLHNDDQIWVFQGWLRRWAVLLGPAANSPLFETDAISDSTSPGIRTQFTFTPAGVVIIPRGDRPYFYDGEVVLPLGYQQRPPAPTGLGPHTTGTYQDGVTLGNIYKDEAGTDPEFLESGVNNRGYAHDTQEGLNSGATPDFGTFGLGTIRVPPDTTELSGILLDAKYQAVMQWIDLWGNLSPLSGRSAPVVFDTQYSSRIAGTQQVVGRADAAKKQACWANLSNGPEGTIGKIVGRSKDILHSGTNKMFEVPSHVGSGAAQFATVPDNVAEIFPDNTPDVALVRELREVAPVRNFKLATVAFGRLWAANYEDAPGLLRPSAPGLWGTFYEDELLFPDPKGAEITGLWAVENGLLVFTASSTYFVTESDDGQRFRSSTLHPSIGCVSPDSIATLPSGLTVWLGREGFFAFEGGSVSRISADVDPYLKEANWGRAVTACAAVDPTYKEYRCWVPSAGGRKPNLCYTFDGTGWRERTDMLSVSGVCVAADSRGYMIVSGESVGATPHQASDTTRDGVWILDHENFGYEPARPRTSLETAWLTGISGQGRASQMRVALWLRETTANSGVTVLVYRDWRKRGGANQDIADQQYTTTFTLLPQDDLPPVWGTAAYDNNVVWAKRRPYWQKFEVWVPSCEVFKLEILVNGSTMFEFIGLSVDKAERENGGSRLP